MQALHDQLISNKCESLACLRPSESLCGRLPDSMYLLGKRPQKLSGALGRGPDSRCTTRAVRINKLHRLDGIRELHLICLLYDSILVRL